MPQTRRGLAKVSDPIDRLAIKPFCEFPTPHLTLEQKLAIHEFFHTVLAAGYKLYQIVPQELASSVLLKKFEMMTGRPSTRSGGAH
jgi:hypothetical protein